MGDKRADQSGESAGGNSPVFVTTHWSVVLSAGQRDSPQATEALEKLCRLYWYPLYAFVRRRGHGPEDAQDLTQEFFAQLLRKNYPARADRAKGKFRTFLLHTLNQFLVDQRERASAIKRGGGEKFISLDEQAPEDRYRLEVPDELTPEKLFERRWAQTILDRALARLRAEFVAEGKEAAYEVLQTFEPGEQNTLSYAEAATRLAVSESAVKSMIHRMRQRHRELVREGIAQTVATVSEIDNELRYLVSVLRR
jgi:RNA polymerase sigma factor (sigma-70 family)